MIRILAAFAVVAAVGIGTAHADLLDGFEDGNITEYTTTGTMATSVIGAAAHDGAYGLRFSSGNSGWLYRTDVTVSQGDRLSAWARFDRTAGSRIYLGFGASASGALSFVLAANSGDIRLQENAGYSFTEKNTSAQSFTADKWYRMEVVWGAGGAVTGNLYDSDGTTLLNSVSDNLDNSITSGGIALRSFGGERSMDTIERNAPEPASLALVALGALAIARRRRKTA